MKENQKNNFQYQFLHVYEDLENYIYGILYIKMISKVWRMQYAQAAKMVGEKYAKDTQQYRAVPKHQHIFQLSSILEAKPTRTPFQGTFPQYPIQEEWVHNKLPYAAYFWQPRGKPKGVVINYHALNAHTGLSGHLAEALADARYITCGYDYKNFGKTGGQAIGMIDSVEELISTSEDFLMYVQRKYPKLPIYLSGLSLGGLMAYYVSLRKHVHVAGTILHNPAFTDNPLNNSLGKRLIGRFGKVLPPMKLTTSLRNRSTSYSLTEYKKHDKHMYSGRIWSTTVCSLLAEMGQSISTFEKFTLPYLCIQGGTDKIVNPFIVFQLEQRSKSKDKETIMIHDMWHGLWFDDYRSQVIDLTLRWLACH